MSKGINEVRESAFSHIASIKAFEAMGQIWQRPEMRSRLGGILETARSPVDRGSERQREW